MFYFPFCALTNGGEVSVCPVRGYHVFLLLDSGCSHSEILFVHKMSIKNNMTCQCDLSLKMQEVQCNSL